MDRRQFITLGAGGAAAALAGCATRGPAADAIKNVRAESPERQAEKRSALESAQELGPTITDVEIPESAFVRFSSASDASPGTMVSLLLTRAIDARYPRREKTIKGGYVVNGRPMLHAPKSHHNCVTTVRYDYSERLKNMPFDRQCTALRGITFVQSDEEYVQKMMTAVSSRYRAILAMPGSAEEKEQTFGRMIAGGRLFLTQIVSYVGQWKHKAIELNQQY